MTRLARLQLICGRAKIGNGRLSDGKGTGRYPCFPPRAIRGFYSPPYRRKHQRGISPTGGRSGIDLRQSPNGSSKKAMQWMWRLAEDRSPTRLVFKPKLRRRYREHHFPMEIRGIDAPTFSPQRRLFRARGIDFDVLGRRKKFSWANCRRSVMLGRSGKTSINGLAVSRLVGGVAIEKWRGAVGCRRWSPGQNHSKILKLPGDPWWSSSSASVGRAMFKPA